MAQLCKLVFFCSCLLLASRALTAQRSTTQGSRPTMPAPNSAPTSDVLLGSMQSTHTSKALEPTPTTPVPLKSQTYESASLFIPSSQHTTPLSISSVKTTPTNSHAPMISAGNSVSSQHTNPTSSILPSLKIRATPTQVTSIEPTPTQITSIQATPSPSPYIMFANRNTIRRVNLNSDIPQTVVGNSSILANAVAIDYDWRRNLLFWTDVSVDRIVMADLNGGNTRIIIDRDIPVADGLAWDWLGEKLYWTDAEDHEIEVMDPQTRERQQLLYTGNSTIPRGVIVDPIITKCIYWTDWGQEAKIERLSLDGAAQTRQVLHNTDLVWPNDLTLDYSTLTIYWADAFLDKIESSHIDGSNRTLITLSTILHPFSITFFEDKLFWSDWSFDQILRLSLNDPDNVTMVTPRLLTEPMGIKVIHPSRQPLGGQVSPCSVSNGNCSHLCLLSSIDPSGYSCSCPQGMQLSEDRQNCTNVNATATPAPTEGSCAAAGYTDCCVGGACLGAPPTCFCDAFCSETNSCCSDFSTVCVTDYLVFANRRHIQRLELSNTSLRTLYTQNGVNFVGLDYNYRHGFMYWTELTTGSILRGALQGESVTLLVNGSLQVPDGLAVDWLTNKLYWSEATPETISVLDLERGHQRTLLTLPESSIPRGIALDPVNGYMFWTDWGSPGKVERAYMDGSGRITLADTSLVWPNDITIDYQSQTLYWVDANLDKIESAAYDGSNRQLVISTGVFHPFSITVFNGTLYWTDWQIDAIFAKPPQSSTASIVYSGLSTEPMSIEAISPSRQANVATPCDVANGNCEQLCLLSVNRTATCACADGYSLNSDRRTCNVIAPPTTSPMPVTTTTPLVGSCARAGYTDCCEGGSCQGAPSTCFCDIFCVAFGDCCEDFFEICQVSTVTPTPSLTGLSTSSSPPIKSSVVSTFVSVQLTSSSVAAPINPTSSLVTMVISNTPQPTMNGNPDGPISETAIRVGAGVGSVIIILLLSVLITLIIIFIVLKRRTSIKYATFDNPPESSSQENRMAFLNPISKEISISDDLDKPLELDSELDRSE